MSRKRSRRSGENGEGAGTFLIRYGSLLLFAVVVILVVLTMGSCTIRKPEAPQWDTQFVVPMVSHTYAMPELIRKMNQPGVGFDIDSNVVFSISRPIDTIFLSSDNLTTASLSYSVSKALGKIALTPPSLAAVVVPESQLAGLPGVYPITIGPDSFTVPASLPAISTFDSAVVDTGKIWIVLTNSLGLNLDTVKVVVTDVVSSSIVSNSAVPGGIPDGGTDSVLVDLGGRTISNTFSVSAYCHTAGGTVADGTGKQFVVTPRFVGDMVVSSARAELPAISRSVQSSLDLQESDMVTDAAITGGNLTLTISNNTPVRATLTISIPDLKLNGSAFTLDTTINGSASAIINVPLAGYHLHPADVTLPQSLPISVQADVPSTSPNKVTVDENQNFHLDATISALTFGSVSGTFAGITDTISPIIRTLDVPKGFDSAQLVSAVLTLQIENSIGLAGTLNVNLQGSNSKNMNLSGPIAARSLATAATTELVEPNVADFLSPIPSQVTLTGTASFGAGQSGTIRNGDYITGNIRIDAPIELVLNQTSLETDVSSDSVSQKDIDKITNHVKRARFVYNITNHLPVGASVNIVISSDSASLYTNPELRFDSISVNAAPVLNSIVSDTLSTGVQSIEVDSAQVQILRHPVLYVGNELILHGSNGQTIKLTKNDYVSVQGRIEVEYHFDGNL